MALVLQPCGDSDAMGHFVDTIEHPVPLARLREHLSDTEMALFPPTTPAEVPVWGVTPGKGEVNKRKWDRMQSGDVLFLYRQKRIFATARIGHKFHSPSAARALWRENADGETWEYMFVLTEMSPSDIPIETFNAAAGYQPNAIIQGFQVLPEDKSDAILSDLELGERPDIAVARMSVEELQQKLQRLQGDLTVPRPAKGRLEQGLFREFLFGGQAHAACGICGQRFPTELLVTAHIKKRASCSNDERRNVHVVMAACRLGCDELFERSYIMVDEAGTIRENPGIDATGGLVGHIDALRGKRCLAWTPDTAAFFEWHRRHARRVFVRT